MAISDLALVEAWKEVLTLSRLERGEQVSLLVSDDSNPQLVSTARIAVGQLGGILTILTLPPMNGDVALSRDKSGYVGKTYRADFSWPRVAIQRLRDTARFGWNLRNAYSD